MHLVTLSLDSIQFGAPLPYALRDANGTLLAGKGYVIKNQAALEKLLGNGFDIFVDVVDVENHRAYIKRLHHMVSENQALGAIASTKLGPGSDPARVEVGAGPLHHAAVGAQDLLGVVTHQAFEGRAHVDDGRVGA